MNHLQETARYYAKLAEEAQTQLQEERELNESLVEIIDALCEELGIDTEELLGEMAMTAGAYKAALDDMSKKKQHTKGRYRAEDDLDDKLRSDSVYGEGGKVVHPGTPGLGWLMGINNPSDKDVDTVKGIVGKVGHIVSAKPDDSYATDQHDTTQPGGIQHDATYSHAVPHPVHSRMAKPPATTRSTTPPAKKAAKKK
jgi:hypothetical protein